MRFLAIDQGLNSRARNPVAGTSSTSTRRVARHAYRREYPTRDFPYTALTLPTLWLSFFSFYIIYDDRSAV